MHIVGVKALIKYIAVLCNNSNKITDSIATLINTYEHLNYNYSLYALYRHFVTDSLKLMITSPGFLAFTTAVPDTIILAPA